MRTIRFWFPAVLWAVLIFLLSAQPLIPEVGPRFPHKDKIAHLVIYAALGWLVGRALRHGHRLALPNAVVLAIFITALYGASDEWHQSFVPNRTAEIADWLVDVLGAALGQIAHWYDARKSSKTNR